VLDVGGCDAGDLVTGDETDVFHVALEDLWLNETQQCCHLQQAVLDQGDHVYCSSL
jgi:hypothetical protein